MTLADNTAGTCKAGPIGAGNLPYTEIHHKESRLIYIVGPEEHLGGGNVLPLA